MSEHQSSKSPSLPLAGDKKTPLSWKAGIVGVIIICAVFALIHRKEQPVLEAKKEAIGHAASINPVTAKQHPIAVTPSVTNISVNTQETILKQQITAARMKDFLARLEEPQKAHGISAVSVSSSSIQDTHALATENQNSAFLAQASDSPVAHVYATRLRPLPYIIGQGKFIFGVLATAINSDLPGQITAIVSEDIYGETGRRILIPKGSRLIGQYRSGLSSGQSRLFMVWTRLIEPNGITIPLGSTGTDGLGRSGLTGHVDHHFLERFGSSILLSLISAGAATSGVSGADEYNSAAAYRQGVSQALSEQAKNMFSQSTGIPPTVHIAQGEKIRVFVNRDLDFSKIIA